MNALELYAIAAPAVAFVLMGAFGFLLFRRDVASFKLSAARNSASAAPAFEGRPVKGSAVDQSESVGGVDVALSGSSDVTGSDVGKDYFTLDNGAGAVQVTEFRRYDAPPAPEPVEAAPAVKPRRTAPAADRAALPASFDDAWPKPDRAKPSDAPLPPRAGRTPSTFTEAGAEPDRQPPAARSEDAPPVTVLKSGVVDGMAYSLYSDGSIEAQMPEGMLRFASIDELRAHLDHRP
jgi:hypothetical protein